MLSSIAQVFSLIFDHIRMFIFEEIFSSNINLPDILLKLISILIAFYSIFILYSIISAVATYKSYEIAVQGKSYKKPDLEDVFFKAISWNFYRLIYILSPLLSIGAITGILFLLNVILFNIILSIA
jgi:uncharacterized membrane protein